jgi:hypothetical protein
MQPSTARTSRSFCTATETSPNYKLNCSFPGSPTFSAESVTTGVTGTRASAANSGTANTSMLNSAIPKGIQGQAALLGTERGAYGLSTTSAVEDVVAYGGPSYASLIANNIVHAPDTSIDQWKLLTNLLNLPPAFASQSAANPQAGTFSTDTATTMVAADTKFSGPSVDIRSYGALCNGTNDDTAAIQAAFDAYKPATGNNPTTGTQFIFPPSLCRISALVHHYSGQRLVGQNGMGGSGFKALFGFRGTAMLQCNQATNGDGFCANWSLENLMFDDNGLNLIAHQMGTGITTNLAGYVHNIALFTGYGFIYNMNAGASQSLVIDGINSQGRINQMLYLTGNRNYIQNLDKEGDSGTTTDPYIYCGSWTSGRRTYTSAGNTFRNLLIEGKGNTNKAAMVLNNCPNNIIDTVWIELSASNGYSLVLENGSNATIIKGPFAFGNQGLLSVISKSSATIDFLSSNANSTPFSSILNVDSTSYVHVLSAQTRYNNDLQKQANKNIWVDSFQQQAAITDPFFNYNLRQTAIGATQNLLVNPSFEAGTYGWALANIDSTELVPSENGVGNELHISFAADDSSQAYIYQSIPIAAGQLGNHYTFSLLVRLSNVLYASPGWAISGCGLTNNAFNEYAVQQPGTGWETVTVPIVIQTNSACTLQVGYTFYHKTNMGDAYIDEASLMIGDSAGLDPSKFGSFELNGVIQTYASAAPTTGTWMLGAVVWNTHPTASRILGWVNIAAGSPGTWSPISLISTYKGTFTCTAGGTITVSNANMLTTSNVVISLNAQAGMITTTPTMKTATPGTGFTVLCGTLDTSVYNYSIQN